MLIFYLIILCLGVFIAIQAGLNSNLSTAINSSVWSAVISFAVGTLVLVAYALGSQAELSFNKLLNVPPYLFVGGMLGASYVLGVIVLYPKIGAVNIVIFTVLGQMLCSSIIDHYGWFGVQQSFINWQKVGALLLMLVAIILFQKSK
ncbi:MAG: hypothetical protein CSA42_06145 [Gammaproteobacteria bacterium]|nr:MAG: hypothetical protein CSA42_06145 [Gammaproteobacteria bacterium]